MRCLVTGGAGFIGSHLVDALVGRGDKVTVLDDFSTGRKENLAAHASAITIIQKSICDELADTFSAGRFNIVFHVAAVPRVQFSIEQPQETHNTNVTGTLNVLEACRRAGVKRIIFSSSSAIYGDQDTLPLIETMTPNPMSPYASHKLISEQYCRLYYQLYGLETISLRYFNVFGPRQDPNGDYAGLIPKFISLISKNETPTINGDGEQTRDFIYVKDVVAANLQAAATNDKRCFGETFNIGAGANQSVNAITNIIAKLCGNIVTPHHGPNVIEPHHTLANVNKAAALLKWSPATLFDDGIATAYHHFKTA